MNFYMISSYSCTIHHSGCRFVKFEREFIFSLTIFNCVKIEFFSSQFFLKSYHIVTTSVALGFDASCIYIFF
jgi:hypothetical protein